MNERIDSFRHLKVKDDAYIGQVDSSGHQVSTEDDLDFHEAHFLKSEDPLLLALVSIKKEHFWILLQLCPQVGRQVLRVDLVVVENQHLSRGYKILQQG
jgi:hypothetical protein